MSTEDYLDFLPLFQETMATIRARLDTDLNAGLDPSDERNVDVRPGNFYFDITQPVIMEIARLWDAIATEVPAASSPATAWGDYLDMHASVFGLERKEAVAAVGGVRFVGEWDAIVPAGTIVSATTNDPDVEPPEFRTIENITIAPVLPTPTAPSATPSGTGGTLPAGTYEYVVTAVDEWGETLASASSGPVVVTGSTSKISLGWGVPVEADVEPPAEPRSYLDGNHIEAYRVYRKLGSGWFRNKATVLGGGNTYYEDTSATYESLNEAPTADNDPGYNTTGGTWAWCEAIEPGPGGNVSAGAITTLESPLPAVESVINPYPFTGGEEPETDEELRERLLRSYAGTGAGTVNDYVRWALEHPGVGRASVEPLWNGPGTVRVTVMTSDGKPVNEAVVVPELQAVLDPLPGKGHGLAPIGAVVTVATPSTVTVKVTVAVVFNPGYSADGASGTIATLPAITESLNAYFDALTVGENVIKNRVLGAVITVEGIQQVSVTFPAADVAIGATQIAVLNPDIDVSESGPYVP